jgi:hypothetical protein
VDLKGWSPQHLRAGGAKGFCPGKFMNFSSGLYTTFRRRLYDAPRMTNGPQVFAGQWFSG